MGILSTTKTASVEKIKCGESFDLTLGLSASPDIASKPKEIVLVLDKSGSMTGAPLVSLKGAVQKFLDILDLESDGVQNGIIGADSQVAMVSFSTTATIDVKLTNSTQQLKTALANLSASGSTNHADAFKKGFEALNVPSGKEKIMILFTDGQSNPGSEGFAEAQKIRSAGIKLYCVGYGQHSNLKTDAIYKWVSAPSAAYALISPDLADIETAFTGLVQNIANPGASNISVTDTVSDCFDIITVKNTTKGTAKILNSKSIKWDISELGKTAGEAAVCTFTLKSKNSGCTGNVAVNESLLYSDKENNQVAFISPKVNITCETKPSVTEECPAPVNITVEGCKDSLQADLGDVELSSLGRVLQLNLNLKNICPNKRVGLALALYETDVNGIEYPRGLKTLLIPAHTENECTDVAVKCIKFVLPEELDETGDKNSICNPRSFKAIAFANYIDTDFKCCEVI